MFISFLTLRYVLNFETTPYLRVSLTFKTFLVLFSIPARWTTYNYNVFIYVWIFLTFTHLTTPLCPLLSTKDWEIKQLSLLECASSKLVFSFSSAVFPELLDCMVVLFSVPGGTSVLFWRVAIPVTFPQTVHKSSLFPTSLTTLFICCIFDDSHSEGCEVTLDLESFTSDGLKSTWQEKKFSVSRKDMAERVDTS